MSRSSSPNTTPPGADPNRPTDRPAARSYFDLLEEKYATEDEPKHAIPDTAPPSPAPRRRTSKTEGTTASPARPLQTETRPRRSRRALPLLILALTLFGLGKLYHSSLSPDSDPKAPDTRHPRQSSTPADLVAPHDPNAPDSEILEPRPATETPTAHSEPPAPAPSPSPFSTTLEDGPAPDRGSIADTEPGTIAPAESLPSSGPAAADNDSNAADTETGEAAGVEELNTNPSSTETPGVDSSRTVAPPNPPPAAPLEVLPPVPYTSAQKIFAPQPPYPAEARRRGETGTVVVKGTVTPQGDIRDAHVVESVSPALDQVALEAFRTWQFQPPTRNKIPVSGEYSVAFRFALDAAAEATEDAETDRPEPLPAGTDDDPLPWQGPFVPPSRYYSPLPAYPQSAWATGTQGTVTLEVVVRTDGRVAAVRVLEGLPNGIDDAAIAAVSRWQFQPATRDGRAVAVYHRLTLKFAP